MTEFELHKSIVLYLKLHHPEVIFRTDYAAGLKMTPRQARKHATLQKSRGFPDLFICEPRAGFHGLFIELKKEGTKLRTKDGDRGIKFSEGDILRGGM